MTDAVLRFGLPSKGRLQTQMSDFFAAHGVGFICSKDDRAYAGRLRGIPDVEIVFFSAGEMPHKLVSGDVHLAVTGEDLLRERAGTGPDLALNGVERVKPLGFGHARLIVAAPKCWIDVETTEDLDDIAADFRDRYGHPLRIATKYPRLARWFFRKQSVVNYRLIESQGATEGLVSARSAEAIIDITSSGDTLRANHLKVLVDGVILRSEAQLAKSLNAHWSPAARAAFGNLMQMLALD